MRSGTRIEKNKEGLSSHVNISAKKSVDTLHEPDNAFRANMTHFNFPKQSIYSYKSGFPLGIQPKLSINEPGDKYEQEADAISDKVMRMERPDIYMKALPVSDIQRQYAYCEAEEKLQRKESETTSTPTNNSFENYVSGLNNGGQPLPAELRNFYEPRFGYDFSKVRIHDDAAATQSAQSINALAYTHGNNIVFNSGQYSPQSNTGKRLLSHELTHVVQQNKNIIQRQEVCGPVTYDEAEQVCRPSDPEDYTPQVSEDMEIDGEFWTFPPRMRQPVKPIIDEETNKVVGFKYGGSYWEIYDLEGNMVESGELALESPLIDPIDLIAGGLTGLGRSLLRTGVRSTGRAVATSAAKSAGSSLLRNGIGIALRTLSHRTATLIKATYRAIKFKGVLNFTFTTASRMADPSRRVPIHILKLALKFGKRLPDPQGVAGAFRYTIPMIRNSTQYTLEVVIRESDNTILHFLYK